MINLDNYENYDKYVQVLKDYEVEHNKLKPLACYLISLFYKSGCKYYCGRTKINRLLTIYKFCSVQFDPDCFGPFFRTDGPYMIINDLNAWVDRDVYFLTGDDIDCKEEYTGDFNEQVSIPSRYQFDENLIIKQSKMLLEIIFRKFGSYSTNDLGPLINEMHPHIPFSMKQYKYKEMCLRNSLDVSEFLNFLTSDESDARFQDNEIFKFIKDFNCDLLKNNGVIDESYLRNAKEKEKIK